jgi:hypothetical protein
MVVRGQPAISDNPHDRKEDGRSAAHGSARRDRIDKRYVDERRFKSAPPSRGALSSLQLHYAVTRTTHVHRAKAMALEPAPPQG